MFEPNVRYRLHREPTVVVEGHRIGSVAVAFGVRLKGVATRSGFWVDHIRTGRAVVWANTFYDALEVADAAALVLGSAQTFEGAAKRFEAAAFMSWVALPYPRQSFSHWHHERFGRAPAAARVSREQMLRYVCR